MPKRNVNEDLERCITQWIGKQLPGIMNYMIEMCKLWNIDDDNDFLKQELGCEDVKNHRLILTAYMLSRFAESYAGALVSFKVEYKDLWKRLEKASLLPDDSNEIV